MWPRRAPSLLGLAVLLAVAAVVLTAVTAALTQGFATGEPPPTATPEDAVVADDTPSAEVVHPPAAPPPRELVAAPPPPNFDELLAQLVDLALRIRERLEVDDRVTAQALDKQAKALWDELMRCRPPAEEPALFLLGEFLAEDPTPAAEIRRRLCVQLVAEGLTRRLRRFRATGERGPLDHLVTGILATVPGDEALAPALAGLLTSQPYLGLAHEDQVLDLVAAAAEQAFLVEIATGLLRTLWHNLELIGARTSTELAGLALLFKDDANPSRRLAALQHLLSARGGRFREIVVQEVVQGGDAGLARELGVAASIELDPAEALAVLQRLTPVAGASLMAAFMALGERDEVLLQRAYDEQLALDSDPNLRAELVTGAGFRGTPAAVEMARSAFDHDPDAEVRSRAMFVLTSQAGTALGEATLMAALDDPRFGDDPIRLGQIGLALENLVHHGELNAVDRVGHRLLARQKLLPADRERLEALLRRVLPGSGRD